MSTPRKRQASRSPEHGRSAKRPLNSSPEEGEVDDSAPPPPILSIPLPPKPTTKRVPFPFKKKTDPAKNEADEAAASATPPNVFTKFEEDVNKKVAKDELKKPRLSRPPPGKMDHYEPPQRSLLSRIEPREELQGRYSGHGGRRRSRSRSASPSNSYYRASDRHRLPLPRSPMASFSPPSTDKFRDRDYDRDRDRGDKDRDRDRDKDRDRDRDWDRDRDRDRYDDSRRYRPRSPDDRNYRSDNWRRNDTREWTQRDVPYMPDRRSTNRRDDRAYDHDRRDDHWTPRRSSLVSPPRVPPPRTPTPPPIPSPSPPPALPPLAEPRPPSLPPPPMPPTDAGPRPPSSTPPPAPPPDVRLKDTQVPLVHEQVKILAQRPEAPRNVHSPTPLRLPPPPSAKAMAPVPERPIERPPLPPPPQATNEVKEDRKEIEQAKLRMIQRKLPARRSQKVEMHAYDHGFIGCGLKSDYEATTKLGEGTFGCVTLLPSIVHYSN